MTDILVTVPQTKGFDTFFDAEQIQRLEHLGRVQWNVTGQQLTQIQLCEMIQGKDICITGWNTPVLDRAVLANADRLKLIAHTGGSVKPYVPDDAYEKGVRVISGNRLFSISVAEGVIAYALASLRNIPQFSSGLKHGIWPNSFENRSLLDKRIGLVGYGMVARSLVEMLKPFGCTIFIHADYMSREELATQNLVKSELNEIFAQCDIVSLHCGMTDRNYHLIEKKLFGSMKKGALFINTARGAVMNEADFCKVFQARTDLTAVLDVYEQEPLPVDSPLLRLDNVLCMPHMAGPTTDRRLNVTRSLLDDIERFLNDSPLQNEILRGHAARMSTH